MKTPLISVIVPVYKVETYLDQCVQSILAQTYRNLEIILVDDGSPDGCPAMCDAYARQDSRVRVIHQKNGGLSAARNAGMDIMTGQYFGFVDSDDYIDLTMYEKMLAPMTERVRMTQCGFWHYGLDKTRPVQCCEEFEIHDAKEFFRLYHFHKFRAPVWMRLFATENFGHLRFRVGRYAEDHLFTYQVGLEMLKQDLKMMHVPGCLHHYRVVETGITLSYHTPLFIEETRNLKDLVREEADVMKRFGVFDMVDSRRFSHLFRIKALSLTDPFYKKFYDEEFEPDLHGRFYRWRYHWGIRHVFYYLIVQYWPWLFRWQAVRDFCTKRGDELVSKRDRFY